MGFVLFIESWSSEGNVLEQRVDIMLMLENIKSYTSICLAWISMFVFISTRFDKNNKNVRYMYSTCIYNVVSAVWWENKTIEQKLDFLNIEHLVYVVFTFSEV